MINEIDMGQARALASEILGSAIMLTVPEGDKSPIEFGAMVRAASYFTGTGPVSMGWTRDEHRERCDAIRTVTHALLGEVDLAGARERGYPHSWEIALQVESLARLLCAMRVGQAWTRV